MTKTSPLPILDAHVHYWDPAKTPRATSLLVKAFARRPALMSALGRTLAPRATVDFIGKPDNVLAPYLPENLVEDAGIHELRGAVHVEAGWKGRGPLGAAGETAWLETLSDKPLAIVGAASLEDTRDLEILLDAHERASPRFRGVRDKLAFGSRRSVMSWAPRARLSSDARFRRGYERLGERGLSFDAFVYSHQLDELASLVSAHPETNVVLCHVGSPVALGGPFGGLGTSERERRSIEAAWRDGMARVAASPHVHVKLSGLGMPVTGFGFHRRRTPPTVDELVESLGPHLRFVLETFGVHRCMFASNFPMDRVSAPYDRFLGAFLRIIEDHTEGERRALLHDNAARFYRID